MKTLLVSTALLEAGAGLAVMVSPSAAVAVVLGSSLETASASTLGRVAGAALFTLGAACWFARRDGASRAARGLVGAMSFYNVAVAAILAYAGTGLGLTAIGLWPAVVLHAAMAVWCVACLRKIGKQPLN